jgi:hypothetical protein
MLYSDLSRIELSPYYGKTYISSKPVRRTAKDGLQRTRRRETKLRPSTCAIYRRA